MSRREPTKMSPAAHRIMKRQSGLLKRAETMERAKASREERQLVLRAREAVLNLMRPKRFKRKPAPEKYPGQRTAYLKSAHRAPQSEVDACNKAWKAKRAARNERRAAKREAA